MAETRDASKRRDEVARPARARAAQAAQHGTIVVQRAGEQPAADHLLWIRSVGGNPREGLEALNANMDLARLHRRIGGYWVLGLQPNGSRGAELQAALDAGRRVFVVGHVQGEVVRALEVGTVPYLPPKATEIADTSTFVRAPQPPTLMLTKGPNAGQAWGTLFQDQTSGQQRVRLHTMEVDDAAWRGATLSGPFGGMNPGLFVTAHPLPLRLRP
jgi:hypothetical protein